MENNVNKIVEGYKWERVLSVAQPSPRCLVAYFCLVFSWSQKKSISIMCTHPCPPYLFLKSLASEKCVSLDLFLSQNENDQLVLLQKTESCRWITSQGRWIPSQMRPGMNIVEPSPCSTPAPWMHFQLSSKITVVYTKAEATAGCDGNNDGNFFLHWVRSLQQKLKTWPNLVFPSASCIA